VKHRFEGPPEGVENSNAGVVPEKVRAARNREVLWTGYKQTPKRVLALASSHVHFVLEILLTWQPDLDFICAFGIA